MSEPPQKVQKYMKQINVCDDVLFDVFGFFGRAEIGLKLALINYRFNALVDDHFMRKKWRIGRMDNICISKCSCMEILRENGTSVKSEFMQMPPKVNLVGSESIVISHFGPKVIEFLHRFLYLINGEISLSLCFHSDAPAWILVPEIWPLLAEKINALSNLSHYRFDLLRQLISPTVLRQCPKLRLIQCQNLFPEPTSAADHAHASLGQALSMWLHTARQDGHPKILRYRGVLGVTQIVEELKTGQFLTHCFCPMNFTGDTLQNFVNASSPISYVISVEFRLFHGSPFDLTNKRTRERLVLRRHMHQHLWNYVYTFWMLTRGPIERDEMQWAEWELEAARWARLFDAAEHDEHDENGLVSLPLSNFEHTPHTFIHQHFQTCY